MTARMIRRGLGPVLLTLTLVAASFAQNDVRKPMRPNGGKPTPPVPGAQPGGEQTGVRPAGRSPRRPGPPATQPVANPTPAPRPGATPPAATPAATPTPATPPATATTPGATAPPPAGSTRVVLEITQNRRDVGSIVIELDTARAPATVANFLRYVDEGFYANTVFHRVLTDSLIQGGAYLSRNQQKTTGLHEPIRNEAHNGLKNVRGTVAMAHTWKQPDSATTQFIINLKDNPGFDADYKDGDGGCCVFGRVVEGMDIVERLARSKTSPSVKVPREQSLPVSAPVIRRAYRFGATPPPLAAPTEPEAVIEVQPSDEGVPTPAPAVETPPMPTPPVPAPMPEPTTDPVTDPMPPPPPAPPAPEPVPSPTPEPVPEPPMPD